MLKDEVNENKWLLNLRLQSYKKKGKIAPHPPQKVAQKKKISIFFEKTAHLFCEIREND